MLRYCPNCGTEVDETALFCPTCGQPVDQAAEVQMPPAPAWPEPEAPAEPAVPPVWDEPDASPAGPSASPPPPLASATEVPPPAEPGQPAAGASAQRDVPLSLPVTLSGWLIGGGAAVGALGALLGLFDGSASILELLLLVVLGSIAASVFAAATLPAIPHLRLGTLVIVLIGFGIALDRVALGGAGVGSTLLIFLGTAAAGIGGILLELGRDEPMGSA